jgi:hypothetical protein
MTGHGLDWVNQPDVYKQYPGIEPVELPRNVVVGGERAEIRATAR